MSGLRPAQKRAGWVQVQAGARPERTLNISLMSVTPAVFHAEMFALNVVKSLKSWAILVMAETSQSAMGPYVAMAEVASAS